MTKAECLEDLVGLGAGRTDAATCLPGDVEGDVANGLEDLYRRLRGEVHARRGQAMLKESLE